MSNTSEGVNCRPSHLVWYTCAGLITISVLVSYWMGNSSSSNMAAPVIVNATAKHTATVIFLHGLGDTGHGWSQAFTMIKEPHIKYICPTANIMPVTLNAGFRMPSWFDIMGLESSSPEDEAGIKTSSELLQRLISEEEKSGVPRNRIMVGGFSQGGAVALFSALTTPKPTLAGIIALSTWLPLNGMFPDAIKSNQQTPIMQCHGKEDPLVRLQWGQMTHDRLEKYNLNTLPFNTYDGMGHSSCDKEMQDVKQFIKENLKPV